MIKMMERAYFKALNDQAKQSASKMVYKKIIKTRPKKVSKSCLVMKEIDMTVIIEETNETNSDNEKSNSPDEDRYIKQPIIGKVRNEDSIKLGNNLRNNKGLEYSLKVESV